MNFYCTYSQTFGTHRWRLIKYQPRRLRPWMTTSWLQWLRSFVVCVPIDLFFLGYGLILSISCSFRSPLFIFSCRTIWFVSFLPFKARLCCHVDRTMHCEIEQKKKRFFIRIICVCVHLIWTKCGGGKSSTKMNYVWMSSQSHCFPSKSFHYIIRLIVENYTF